MNTSKTPSTRPSEEFLAGYRAGLLDGIDVVSEDCDEASTPAPPPAPPGPLAGARPAQPPRAPLGDLDPDENE